MNENRAIAAHTALRLGRYFGTAAKLWLNLQASYELEVAEDQLGPAVMREVLPRPPDDRCGASRGSTPAAS